MRELNVRWIGEKTKEMKRERVREIEERARLVKEDRKRRDKNMVWRGVEGDDRGERRKFINEILWKVLGREVKLGRIKERVGGSGEMGALGGNGGDAGQERGAEERKRDQAQMGGESGRRPHDGREDEMEDGRSGQAGKSKGKTGSGNQQETVGEWKKMALR